MIINFPLAPELVLSEADALLEKSYVDHAIIVLENFLSAQKSRAGREQVQKKLLSCFLLKEDLEAATAVILQLTEQNCLDLPTAAHHIIIAQWQHPKSHQELQTYYKDALNLSPSSFANLLALSYELKDFYENYWAQGFNKKFAAFFEAKELMAALEALGSLEEADAVHFESRRTEVEDYFESKAPKIMKAMLYFLLVEKKLDFAPMFEGVPMKTEAEVWEGFSKQMERAQAALEEQGLDINLVEGLRQHLRLFYYFAFPHHQEIEVPLLIYCLASQLVGLEFPGILEENGRFSPKTKEFEKKVNEYVASLLL